MSQSATGKDVMARRYGRVFFQLAEDQKKIKAVMKDVASLGAAIKGDDKVWEKIVNPTLAPAHLNEIVSALVKVLELSSLTDNFLRVLIERSRLAFLPSILRHCTECYRQEKGQIDATLKSTNPVSQSALTSLSKSLKKTTGLDVTLLHKVEPELLGGVVLQIGSLMVDASVGSRLNKLRQMMKG